MPLPLLPLSRSKFHVGALAHVLAVLLLAPTLARAEAFEATGFIEGEHYLTPSASITHEAAKHGLSLSRRLSYDFKLSASNWCWRIILTPHGAGQKPLPFGRLDAGSAGGDTSVVLYPDTNALSAAAQLVRPPTGLAVAQIYRGPVPFEMNLAPILWLALCSGPYLSSVPTNWIIPVHLGMPPIFGDPPEYFSKRADWTYLADSPNLPRTLTYYDDGVVVRQPDGTFKLESIDPPFDHGYLMARYGVLSVTNRFGYQFPREFRFETFAPRYPDPTNASDTRLTGSWHGTVESITSRTFLSTRQFIPPLPGRIAIADRRYAQAGTPLVGYFTNAWPQLESPPYSRTLQLWSNAVAASAQAAVENSKNHNALKVGDKAPEFEVATLDGKPLRLADFRGKYVLLNFWATWCGPCLAEMPELKSTYDAFKDDKRFAMISLSLDKEVEAPEAYVRTNSLGWFQVFLGDRSRTKVPDAYSVGGIPAIFLVGPNGRIVATDLRGAAIHSAVKRELQPQ